MWRGARVLRRTLNNGGYCHVRLLLRPRNFKWSTQKERCSAGNGQDTTFPFLPEILNFFLCSFFQHSTVIICHHFSCHFRLQHLLTASPSLFLFDLVLLTRRSLPQALADCTLTQARWLRSSAVETAISVNRVKRKKIIRFGFQA